MLKEEYKDAHKDYDKSLISHMNEGYDAMKEHEWSIMHHDEDPTYDNYDSGISHFSD